MRIAVAGMWHLGTVIAACLAEVGHDVEAFDGDSDVIHGLREGILPVAEPGLQDLMRRGIQAGKLHFSSDFRQLGEAEIVWITYDTPVDDADCADAESVLNQALAICHYLRPGVLMLISSQLPVGSTRRLEELFRKDSPNGSVTFAYSPENLRLGKAIESFSRPERVVVGLREPRDRECVMRLFHDFTDRIEWMSVESAEMTKHALNAFLAASIAFINEVAAVCEQVGADSREVERGLKSDPRIGPRAYLRAGQAFAGGTLARDVSSMIMVGREKGLTTHLFSAVQHSNEVHKEWPRRKLAEALGTLRGKSVGVLGLTYKPGTSTLRRSSSIEICRWLHENGSLVTAFDPAIQVLPGELSSFIRLQASIQSALQGADAAFLATEWPEFAVISPDHLVSWMKVPVVVDPDRFLDAALGSDTRIQYFSVGRAK